MELYKECNSLAEGSEWQVAYLSGLNGSLSYELYSVIVLEDWRCVVAMDINDLGVCTLLSGYHRNQWLGGAKLVISS